MSWPTGKGISSDTIRSQQANQGLFPLESYSTLKVSGDDRFSFLQGQVTCDMDRVSKGEALLGAHLNLKGRIEASFIAFNSEDSVLLMLPKNQTEHLLQILQKYALFANASLEICDDFLPFLGWGNDNCLSQLIYRNSSIPQICLGLLSKEQLENLAPDTPIGTEQDALAILARNGFIIAEEQQRAQYLPQELNYDMIDGISFDKGCYKGQEVVARIHFRGQVKQRCQPFAANQEIPPGASVNNDRAASCGQSINYVPPSVSSHSGYGCVLIKTSETESKTLHLEQNDEAELQLLSLPYAIT
ncbi:MAG: hypothetical protein MI867_22875 [Pseudomonadales bacterium]|nr:hypothetical protein [Pseudomonadales bacterium]